MNNVVVAYISISTFRALPRLKAVLGDDFEPSGVPFERTFADEAAAARARDDLHEIGRWGPEDAVLVESSEPVQLDIREAYRLASTHEHWQAVVINSDAQGADLWRLQISTLRRCVSILVGPPMFTIGGGAGFLVDHQHRVVFSRSHYEIATEVCEHEVLRSTIGEFTSHKS
jgi:hypothetical protein